VVFLSAMARRLDGLIAEEALRLSHAVALGAGTLKQSDRDELLHAWRRAAFGGRRRRRADPDVIAAAAAAAGLTVVRH